MARTSLKFLAAVAAAAMAGCSRSPAPLTVAEAPGVRAEVDYADLGKVLAEAVDEEGRLDQAELESHTALLDRQLYRMSLTGPTATPALLPAEADRLAYWYNARAAWSMKLALAAGFPETIDGDRWRVSPFPLDGRTMTLAEIDAILARDADWRTEAAAPSVLLHRPALPRAPLAGGDIRREIPARLNAFLADKARFAIDEKRREVKVPPALWARRDELIRRHHETHGTSGATLLTALLPWTTGLAHHRIQDAMGYRCVPAGPGSRLALVGADDAGP